MRGKLSVVFHGEEGIDAGGVSREWYQVRHPYLNNPCLCHNTRSLQRTVVTLIELGLLTDGEALCVE